MRVMLRVVPALAATALAVLPAAGQRSETRVTGGGGGASVGVTPGKESPVAYETTVGLQKPRQWKSSDGKNIVAELMSWPIRGSVAPKDLKGVKIEVVRDGKIRLRTGGKVVVVALERLSAEDREVVGELARYHERWRGGQPGSEAEGAEVTGSEETSDGGEAAGGR